MPSRSLHLDSLDAQILLAVNVEKVQGDKDGGILPEHDRAKRDVLALMMLRLGDGTNVHRVDGRAEDVLAILWMGDPAGLSTVEDRVSPGLDMERESIYVNVTGAHVETPVAVLVKVDEVEEDDNFGRGDKPALKVDMHGCGAIWCAHVFTSEKV